jgi:preprotein translocase subunit YajC
MTAAARLTLAGRALALFALSSPALAFAQTSAAAPGPGGGGGDVVANLLASPLPLIVVFGGLFYFMIIRPQQARAKAHQATIAAVKRGDTVVLSNGVIGKVAKVEDAELGVEIATGVVVKVVKSMVSEVRGKGAPAAAANDKG